MKWLLGSFIRRSQARLPDWSTRLMALGGALLLAATQSRCAVLPFAPLIAHAVPRILFPDHDPGRQPATAPTAAPDPQIASAVGAPMPVAGDNGSTIDQQDRVAFAPAAAGSIPLRVAAADLVADVSARAVGDVLTVNVTEAVASENKAGTTLSNQRSIAAGVPNFFGIAENFAANDSMLNLGSLINGTSSNSTTGAGDLTAADTFTATVSAVVTEVNPSGTLSIRGERQLRVNGEDDTIHLSGVVRPQDIDASDAIASAQVADLDLSITGTGQSRDKQGDGFATRLFDWLWLF